MRVFHIDRQRSWTGQISRQFQTVQGLIERGHQGGFIVHPGSQLAERARGAGIEGLVVPMRGWRFHTSVVQLAWRLRGRQIDVLHAHGARDHLLALMAARLVGIPHVVRTKHNHTPLRGHMSRWVMRRTSRVVAVSNFVRDQLVEQGLAADHVETIIDAVDVERFRPRDRDPDCARAFGIDPDDIVVGNVSSLHHRKGIDTVLHAFKRLTEEPFGARLRCLLVGKSHEQWAPLVASLGLTGRVLFPGFHEDVPAALSLFDVYMLPSREEALGTSVLEAMAMERPVVVSDAGGLAESVTPTTGIHVKPEDDQGLARAVAALLNDPERARALGQAARQRVVTHYAHHTLVSAKIALYERLILT
jgi:glycosyltransferase involved in cell wall biosynthesis